MRLTCFSSFSSGGSGVEERTSENENVELRFFFSFSFFSFFLGKGGGMGMDEAEELTFSTVTGGRAKRISEFELFTVVGAVFLGVLGGVGDIGLELGALAVIAGFNSLSFAVLTFSVEPLIGSLIDGIFLAIEGSLKTDIFFWR